MKTIISLYTTGGHKLSKQISREAGNPRDLETYYSIGGEAEVFCSNEERERYNREYGRPLVEDVDTLQPDEFAAFCTWLKDNAGLELGGIHYHG